MKTLIFAQLLFLTGGAAARARFSELSYNPMWYRTYDSTSFINIESGELLFAWQLADPDSAADSFYVGIDTLWALPQDVLSDTGNDWDLQVCPNEFCIQGLKAGVWGGNAFFPFGDTVFHAEHHFQFYPAIGPDYRAIAPPGSVVGGLMYARSRTTGEADTVLGYGAWKLAWDSTQRPPVRPVKGYLPRPSDFVISGGVVRYTGPIGIERPPKSNPSRVKLRVGPTPFRSSVRIAPGNAVREVRIYNLSGRLAFLHPGGAAFVWNAGGAAPGLYLVESRSHHALERAKVLKVR